MTNKHSDNCIKTRFKVGRMNFADNVRSGRPLTVTCIKVKEQINHNIGDNQRIRIYKTASEMNVSRGK
jgi:hypothetical protein